MPKPIVALVGRPNVGKSTLFNRLAEERLAVIDEIPGTTRDRLMAEASWGGIAFTIIDTGGIDASKSDIEDCFGELLRDAESCYTFTVDCQMSLTAWLNSPEGECLTLDE